MKAILPLLSTVLALVAAPAVAEDWQKFSSSDAKAYLADVDSIAVEGGVTAIRVAVVPRTAAAGDYHHAVDQFNFRCGANQMRTVMSSDYDESGALTDTYPEPDAEWEAVVARSYPSVVKAIACDGARSSEGSWPSIIAFVDGGRGQADRAGPSSSPAGSP